MRQAGLFAVAVRDLRRGLELPPEDYNLYPTIETVRQFTGTTFAFDFEWEPRTGDITMCGLTDKSYTSICVPFVEPFISELKRIFEAAEVIIGHNIVDADTAYFEKLGWNVSANCTIPCSHNILYNLTTGMGWRLSPRYSQTKYSGKVKVKNKKMKPVTFFQLALNGKHGTAPMLSRVNSVVMEDVLAEMKPGDFITLVTPTGHFKLRMESFEPSPASDKNTSTGTSPFQPPTSAAPSTNTVSESIDESWQTSEALSNLRYEKRSNSFRKV